MKKKKQHYVPKLYLKNFSKNQHDINVFDKVLDKCFSSNVDDIAFKKYYYDFPKVDDVTGEQTYENKLSELESKYAFHLNCLIENLERGFTNLKNKDLRESISEFIGLQQIRTPSGFKSFESLTQQLDKKLKEKNWDVNGWSDHYGSLSSKEHFGYSLYNLSDRSALFFNKIWIIWENKTDLKFITSDSPTLGYWELTKNGFEIYLPLNPEYSLSLFDKRKYGELLKYDSQILTIKRESVIYYNFKVFGNAERQCYSINNEFEYLINGK